MRPVIASSILSDRLIISSYPSRHYCFALILRDTFPAVMDGRMKYCLHPLCVSSRTAYQHKRADPCRSCALQSSYTLLRSFVLPLLRYPHSNIREGCEIVRRCTCSYPTRLAYQPLQFRARSEMPLLLIMATPFFLLLII